MVPAGRRAVSPVGCRAEISNPPRPWHRLALPIFRLVTLAGGDPPARACRPDFRRALVGQGLHHASIITTSVNNVNRDYDYDSAGLSISPMLYSLDLWLRRNFIRARR